MANDETSNPIFLDTASASILLTKRFEVLAIRWVSKSAGAGDDVQLQDKNGNVMWASVAAAANYVEESHWDLDEPLVFNGLIPAIVDSGQVYLYTKNKAPI